MRFVPFTKVASGSYSDSVAETLSAADTVSSVAIRVGAAAETATAADTVSAATVRVGAAAETATAADTVSATVTRVGAVAESASAADTVSSTLSPRTYYVSAAGSDSNDGRSSGSPKQTISAVNGLTLLDGDTVLFRGGDTFSSSASLSHTTDGITYGSYGTGRATINITANVDGIVAYNRDRVTVQNLIVTGPGATSTKSGILVYRDSGNVSAATISGCDVSGFNDGIVGGGESGCTIAGVTVSGCVATGNNRSGVNFFHATRYGCDDIEVTNSTAYANGQTGIVLGFCQNSAIRYCASYGNGTTTDAGVGIFAYACKDSVVEFCESYDNLTPASSDGNGFSVENSEGVTVQYCYAHGNEGAGFIAYNSATTGGSSDGVTFRFNIAENNVNRAGTGYGDLMVGTDSTTLNHTNLRFYNNTVYQSRSGKAAVQWDDLDTTGIFVNNIIQVAGGASTRAGSGGGTVTFNGNCWYGGTSYGSNAITTDPLLVSPGGGATIGIWNPSSLNGYRLQSGSPCLDTGIDIASTYSVSIGSADFFGNAIGTLPTNVGSYDGAAIGTSAVAETLSAAEAVSAVLVRAGAVAEAGSAADTVAAAAVRVGAVAESGAAADTPAAAMVRVGAVAEAGTATDTPNATFVAPVTVAETASAADTSTSALGASTISVSVSESATAADTVSAVLARAGAVAETGTATDTVSSAHVMPSTVAETASAADTVSAGATYSKSVAETASAADTVSASVARVGSVAESASAADTVAAILAAAAAVAEALDAQDASTATGGSDVNNVDISRPINLRGTRDTRSSLSGSWDRSSELEGAL